MSAYNNNDDDDDDLLASLGGSLFKDLLADLQAEENDVLGSGAGGGAGSGGEAVGWLSLEQLEQELSHLDAKGSSFSSSSGGGGGATLFGSTTGDAGREHFHLPPLSAASLVVDRHYAQAQLLQQQQQPSSSSSSIQQLLQTTTVTMVAPQQHADAWSLSWQQFGDTAQDFLQADAATRKQQQTTTTTTVRPASSSSIDFSQAQEYNISEQPRISPDVLAPPPGMAQGEKGGGGESQRQPPPPLSIPEAPVSATTGTTTTADVASVDLLQQAANKLLKDLQQQQQQQPSQALGDSNTAAEPTVLAPIDESMAAPASTLPPDQGPPVTTLPKFAKPALTPQNSVTLGPDSQVLTMTASQQQQQPSPASSAAPPMPPTSMAVPYRQALPPQVALMQQQQQQQGHPGMMQHGPPHPHQQQQPPPMMMQQRGPLPPPPHAMMPSVPVAIPVARAPWSTATQIMPPSTPAPRVVLCHPRAAPIPAAHLASKYMSPRDIAYVVHSILKTLNANNNTSPTDYDEQWFARQTGTSVPTSRSYAQSRTNQNESTDGAPSGMDPLESRAERAKAWSTQHAVLGHVAKANVARPRALIANPALAATAGSNVTGGESGSEQENAKKQRAVLWKARLYCDRAYQAFFAVMETWQSSRNVAQVQPHLMKLLKCLGVTSSAAAASTNPNAPATEPATTLAVVIDPEPLKLVCKLNKGRILLARIMEQALLPPQAMSSMLPTVWSVCLSASSTVMAPSSQRGMMTTTIMLSDPTDDRLFAALARVLTSLPNLDGAISLACLQTILKQPSKAVLESTVRMQAAHALLQRGASLVTAPGSEGALAAEWSKAEEEFMQLLQGQR